MTLTKSQIAKLSPAEKKARAKAIAYKREYHKNRKLKKIAKKMAPKLNSAIKEHRVKNSVERLETLVRELRDTRSKEKSILEEIRSIQL